MLWLQGKKEFKDKLWVKVGESQTEVHGEGVHWGRSAGMSRGEGHSAGQAVPLCGALVSGMELT